MALVESHGRRGSWIQVLYSSAWWETRQWAEFERRVVQKGMRPFHPGDSEAGVQVVQGGCAGSILGGFQTLTGHSPEHPGLSLELVLPEHEAALEMS